MGAIRGANKSVLRLLKGSWKHIGHLEWQGALPANQPHHQAIWFQGKKLLKRKDNAPRSFHLHCRVPLRSLALSTSWSENINPTPFQDTRQSLRVRNTCLSGSTHPCPTAVHMKPFSTSVFKALTWRFASAIKICGRSCFTQAYAKSFIANPPMPSNSFLHHVTTWVSVARLSAISGLVHSASELLHTPWRTSTSMTTILLLKRTNTLHGFWWTSTWAR